LDQARVNDSISHSKSCCYCLYNYCHCREETLYLDLYVDKNIMQCT